MKTLPSSLNMMSARPSKQEQMLLISSYHFALGPDTSSSATIAAYLNNLQYSLDDVPNWFMRSQYKVTAATYCTFNAFSRVDVRVEVRIPGGVVGYMVDLKGEK
ncbi:hypothetical protein HDU93_001395 [Gonapodya sp. JEL0774]|nr:hypothetical protein HDU93_001395 [Gonapodya sp. JEL0774]